MADLQIRGFGTMNIGGMDERPFHLGTYQARMFCEQQGIDLGAYQDALATLTEGGLKSAVVVEVLLWSALQAGAKFKKLPQNFDADDVSFWMAEADAGEVAKLFQVAESLAATAPDPGNAPGQPATNPK